METLRMPTIKETNQASIEFGQKLRRLGIDINELQKGATKINYDGSIEYPESEGLNNSSVQGESKP